jgi:hypothetical protein
MLEPFQLNVREIFNVILNGSDDEVIHIPKPEFEMVQQECFKII